jgi:capsular polysaccharide biosynthesis protein
VIYVLNQEKHLLSLFTIIIFCNLCFLSFFIQTEEFSAAAFVWLVGRAPISSDIFANFQTYHVEDLNEPLMLKSL